MPKGPKVRPCKVCEIEGHWVEPTCGACRHADYNLRTNTVKQALKKTIAKRKLAKQEYRWEDVRALITLEDKYRNAIRQHLARRRMRARKKNDGR